MTAESGLVIVDKPAGWTSHDVVAKIRKLAATKRVGHAGTLDPMATGVLVVGVEKATRLLGYLALTQKEYTGTIRLGQSTDTDDADGAITGHVPVRNISKSELESAIARLTGEISQVPPGVSAIKVGGKRSYRLARDGAAPELAPRTVTVSVFAVEQVRPAGDVLDVDVRVNRAAPHQGGPVPHQPGRHAGAAGGAVRADPARGGGCRGIRTPRPDRG